jgi:tripartite-type tricarboxylate transporter receptor subunit TctC
VQDTIGGTLHVVIESLSAPAGPIQAGSLKPLAVAAARRLPEFPDVPTIAEAVPQLGQLEGRGWLALTAPAGTPDAIVQKVNGDLRAVLNEPEVKRKLNLLGSYPRALSTAETAAFIRQEQELWRPIVRQIDPGGL